MLPQILSKFLSEVVLTGVVSLGFLHFSSLKQAEEIAILRRKYQEDMTIL